MIGPVTRVNLINQLLIIQSHVESQILTRKDEESQSSGSAVFLGPLVVRMLTWLPNGNSNNFRLT